MAVGDQQLSILLTMLQFIALAIPAVAMMLQVVLQYQDRHDIDDSGTGWPFRLIEVSLGLLVVAGILIAIPIIQTMVSGIARIGAILAVSALVFLVGSTWWTLRQPKYPTDEYESVGELFRGIAKQIVKGSSLITTIAVGMLAFYYVNTSISTYLLNNLSEDAAVFLMILTLGITFIIINAIFDFVEPYLREW